MARNFFLTIHGGQFENSAFFDHNFPIDHVSGTWISQSDGWDIEGDTKKELVQLGATVLLFRGS